MWHPVRLVVILVGVLLAAPTLADGPGLDELLDVGTEAERAEEQAREREALDAEARRALERDRAAAADAFRQAVMEMGDVARRLSDQLDPGVSTQRAQQAILDKLDQVIESARQQQSGQGGGGGGQGQARGQDAGSGEVAGQGEGEGEDGEDGEGSGGQGNGAGEHGGEFSPGQVREGDVEDTPLEQLQREWGNLPPRLRDEISEGLDQPYSPVYRELTEAFYRRLAEEEQ